jgi:hypothetical protein
MARDLGERNREDFARYKDDTKKEGKPFFPRAIYHDTVMSLIVVCVIVALAAIWYYDADGVKPGILGPWYTEPADPGTTNFIPRPDWYFYFLFYLLRIFAAGDRLHRHGRHSDDRLVSSSAPVLRPPARTASAHRPVAMVAAVLTVLSMAVLTGRARPRRRRSAPSPSSLFRRGRAAGIHREQGGRSRREASRSPAASTATPISARGVATSARPICRTSERRTTRSSSSST